MTRSEAKQALFDNGNIRALCKHEMGMLIDKIYNEFDDLLKKDVPKSTKKSTKKDTEQVLE